MAKPHGRHQFPQSRGEKIVRVAAFERTMASFNVEMGQKVAASIHKYHTEHVQPRLDWLETPWYRKLWIRLKGLGGRIWARIKGLRKKDVDPGVHSEKEHRVLRVGDPVETTEVGTRLFDGERQTGVVTKIKDGKVSVRRDGIVDVEQVFSPSVWQRTASPNPSEAGSSLVEGESA